MPLLTFVATPCISVGYLQGCTKLDNLMFAKMRKRGFESQLWVPKSFDSEPLHGIKRSDELRPTIRINKVVTSMHSYGDSFSLLSNCYCIGYREHHSVAVRHYRYRHRG